MGLICIQETVLRYLQTKDEDDFELIYKHYKKLFDNMWRDEDITQELCIFLLTILSKYDATKGKFNTFCFIKIRSKYKRLITKQTKKNKEIPVGLAIFEEGGEEE